MKSPDRFNETHQFRFGNGEVETSHIGVAMPVTLGPHRGAIRASILQGSALLLISRSAPKKLDFQKGTLSILGSPPNSTPYQQCWLGSVSVAGDAVADEIMMASTDVSPALDSCVYRPRMLQ